MLAGFWEECLASIDYAFQPIVNPITGSIFAVEALIRSVGGERTFGPCRSIDDFFDTAFREGVLFSLDVALRRKAIEKYLQIPFHRKIRLFYNYDHRMTKMYNYTPNVMEHMMQEYSLPVGNLCMELTEKHKYDYSNAALALDQAVGNSKERGFLVAIDDFGVGYSSFELMYHADPDFIKIDRFLIADIHRDLKKKSYCSHIISLAHLLGITVIAEGVETEAEYSLCKEMGVDLIQGYLVQYPTSSIEDICLVYENIQALGQKHRRSTSEDMAILSREIYPIRPIRINTSMKELFATFQNNPEESFFPVVDGNDFPLGLIHERTFKKFIYSPYGKEVLSNRFFDQSLRKYLTECPIVDIHLPVEKILAVFVNNTESPGIIVTRDQSYCGFLSASSLLKTLNEKNMAYAREMNPLTKLPGNILINNFINQACEDTGNIYYLIYFDFDNFKPFNDRFGFRQGDRAIILFSELLRKRFISSCYFIGHIGGDDFFLGIQVPEHERAEKDDTFVERKITKTIRKFMDSIEPFYQENELLQGQYSARDREGNLRTFDLLSASAAVIKLPAASRSLAQEDLAEVFARLKKEAKSRPERIAMHVSATAEIIAPVLPG